MHKDSYSSGMEKISASDAWKQKTLAAMEHVRAANEAMAPQATPSAHHSAISSQPQDAEHAVSSAEKAKKARVLRFPKALVVAAAVVALVAVPMLSGYLSEENSIGSVAPEAQAFDAPAPATGGEDGTFFSKNAPVEDSALQSNGAQAATNALPETAQALPPTASNNVAPISLDAAMLLLLDGKGYLEGAAAPGGYNPTEQLVVSATLYAGDAPENPHGADAYCFMLTQPAQESSTSTQAATSSAAITFAVWVLG